MSHIMAKKDNEGTVGVEVIANLLKITPRRVQQLSNECIIPRASRGKYKLITAVWGYIDYLKQLNLDNNQPDDLKEVNLRIAKHKAALMELEVSEKSGELVKVEQVISTWSRIFTLIKQSAMAMPTRLVPELLRAENVNKATQIAKEHIENFLNEHSDIELIIDDADTSSDRGNTERLEDSAEQSTTTT